MHARNGTVTTRFPRLPGRLAAGCAAIALVAHAAAQEAPEAADEEPPRRYTVELIVFAYDESVPSGNEIFVPDEPPAELLPEFGDRPAGSALPEDAPRSYGDARETPFTDELPDEPLAPAEPETGPDDPVEPEMGSDDPADASLTDRPPARQWIELDLRAKQQPRMNEIYGRLVDIDAYHPLMRASWTQTTRPRDTAPALHLQSLGSAPQELDGTVQLYEGRFVHLVLDLALDSQDDSPPEDTTYRGDDRRIAGYRDDAFAPSVRYRLEEDRIMRVDEIRYFDHPRLGVIARVTMPEDEEPPIEPREVLTGSD